MKRACYISKEIKSQLTIPRETEIEKDLNKNRGSEKCLGGKLYHPTNES